MATKEQLEKKVNELEQKAKKADKLEEKISRSVAVPIDLLDSLLAYIETNDRVSLKNVAATIREIAEMEQPERFKSHRHGV